MDGHLVSVEIRVEGRADEGMNLDGLSLDEDWIESLDAQPMQSRSSVE